MDVSGAHLAGVDLFAAMRLMVSVLFVTWAYAYVADRRTAVRVGLPVTAAVALFATSVIAGTAMLVVSDHDVEMGKRLQQYFALWVPALAAILLVVALHRLICSMSSVNRRTEVPV